MASLDQWNKETVRGDTTSTSKTSKYREICHYISIRAVEGKSGGWRLYFSDCFVFLYILVCPDESRDLFSRQTLDRNQRQLSLRPNTTTT